MEVGKALRKSIIGLICISSDHSTFEMRAHEIEASGSELKFFFNSLFYCNSGGCHRDKVRCLIEAVAQ